MGDTRRFEVPLARAWLNQAAREAAEGGSVEYVLRASAFLRAALRRSLTEATAAPKKKGPGA